MTSASVDIAAINDLMAATADSIDRYAKAQGRIGASHFAPAFNDRLVERQSILTALQGEVRRLGGEPGQGGTMRASAARMVANITSAVTGRNDRAIIDQIARNEAHIRARFETAMNNPDLSPQAARVIRESFGTVKQGHDRMREIKQAMDGGR
ncbi:MAG: PA2169 family four-helix-bundle protein [Erythrobacter sp.]